MLKNKLVLLNIALVLGLITQASFSTPKSIVIDKNCKIKSSLDRWKEHVQGSDFWNNQLQMIDKELESLLSEPMMAAALNRDFAEMKNESDKEIEKLYKEHPALRPSAADRMREAADALDAAQGERMMEQFRLERIAELRAMRTTVQLRAR